MNTVTTLSLGKLFANITKRDLDGRTPGELVQLVADELRVAAGARRLILRIARTEPGRGTPTETSPVLGADSPLNINLIIPAHAGGLKVNGRPAVLGDLREVVCENFGESPQNPDELTSEDWGVLLRVKLSSFVCWICAYGPRLLSNAVAIEQWMDSIPSVLFVVLAPLAPMDPSTAQGLRHTFITNLERYAPCRPKEDYKFICKQWIEVTKADCVKLWLYNSLAERFDLAAVEGIANKDALAGNSTLAPLPKLGKNCIEHYCHISRQIVFTEDNWSAEYHNQKYIFEPTNQLDKLGCKAVLCVPLLDLDSAGRESAPSIYSVLSINFRNPTTRVWHSDEHLMLMGRLSAHLIAASRVSKEREILLELNDLAQAHLTTPHRSPQYERKEYLHELIQLIQRRISVSGVSIFYKSQFDDSVTCIASTGITDPTNNARVLPEHELVSVTYKPGEGYTGVCYETAIAKILNHVGSEANHHPKYSEARRAEDNSEIDSIALVPIPPLADASLRDRRALGVIRCVNRRPLLHEMQESFFDTFDLRILQLVAQQVAPMLQTFAQRIERDATVSIVSHDLLAPLGMIKRTIDNVVKSWNETRKIRDYALSDMQISTTLALNLALDLNEKQNNVSDIKPEITFLEGDIIARLRAMMHSFAQETSNMRIAFGDFEQIPALLLDRELIERAFFNIMMNAVKYGERGTILEIQPRPANSNGANFIVDVINHGIGITKEEEPHIFTPLYRSPRAMQRTRSGAGLGLSFARKALKLHGGELKLTSSSRPTIFSFYFPKTLAPRSL